MKLTHRPLTDRAWLRAASARKRSQFTATWSDTLDLLEKEVYALQSANMIGRADPVLMMDVTEADLRLDGGVRASARPASPAVAVAFDSIRGPLIFRCDRYGQKSYGAKMDAPWQHNVRAIALTLEALRAVDRYGATESGEQYTGYKALPPGGAAIPAGPAAPADPWAVLSKVTTRTESHLRSWLERGLLEARVRRITHPDMPGGSDEDYAAAVAALVALGVTRG